MYKKPEKEGIYYLKIINAERKVSKAGNEMLELQLEFDELNYFFKTYFSYTFDSGFKALNEFTANIINDKEFIKSFHPEHSDFEKYIGAKFFAVLKFKDNFINVFVIKDNPKREDIINREYMDYIKNESIKPKKEFTDKEMKEIYDSF